MKRKIKVQTQSCMELCSTRNDENGSGGLPSGAKARIHFAAAAARLKSCPDTKQLVSCFFQEAGRVAGDPGKAGHEVFVSF